MTQRTDTNEPAETPPSFIPSGSAGRREPQGGIPSNASLAMPARFPPSHHADGAPRRSESSSSRVSSSRTADSAMREGQSDRRSVHSQGGTPRADSRQPDQRRRTSTAATAAPSRRHGRRIVATILIVLLLAVCLLTTLGWFWVNSRLQRRDLLTDMADTEPSTWLILGSDERDGTPGTGSQADTSGSRTDTILMLTRPRSGPSSLISIPRDSLVNAGGRQMKINAVGEILGYKSLTAEVEDISKHKVDHVAMIRFGGLTKVVDALGGIRLCYDRTVNDALSGLDWKAGCHTADGKTALAFSRMRYSDPKGDFGRAERQRQVIAAISVKAATPAVLANPVRLAAVGNASLDAVVVDHDTSPLTLVRMLRAFSAATGKDGVTGSVYWTNPGYAVAGLGSTVLLDEQRNIALFARLGDGSQTAGTVGGLK